MGMPPFYNLLIFSEIAIKLLSSTVTIWPIMNDCRGPVSVSIDSLQHPSQRDTISCSLCSVANKHGKRIYMHGKSAGLGSCSISGPVRVPTGAALASLRMEYWRCIAGTHRSCVWRIVIKVIRGHSPYDPHSFLPALLQEG